MTLHWCQFKTAVLLDDGLLADAVVDETIFDLIKDEELPEGWSFYSTGISGAAGFIVEFNIDDLPTEEQLKAVEAYLKKLNTP